MTLSKSLPVAIALGFAGAALVISTALASSVDPSTRQVPGDKRGQVRGEKPSPLVERTRDTNSQSVMIRPGVYLKTRGGGVQILSEPDIKSKGELVSYRAAQLSLLDSPAVSSAKSATVTFRRPLDPTTVRALLSEVDVNSVTYKSYPQGTGSMPLNPTRAQTSEFAALEAQIAEQQRTLNGISEFRLVDGFIAASVVGRVETYRRLAADPLVFLVDVGPVDIRAQHPNAAIGHINTVYYQLEQYGE